MPFFQLGSVSYNIRAFPGYATAWRVAIDRPAAGFESVDIDETDAESLCGLGLDCFASRSCGRLQPEG
jgi:hypothetical protein